MIKLITEILLNIVVIASATKLVLGDNIDNETAVTVALLSVGALIIIGVIIYLMQNNTYPDNENFYSYPASRFSYGNYDRPYNPTEVACGNNKDKYKPMKNTDGPYDAWGSWGYRGW